MSNRFGNFEFVIVGAGSAGCLLANRLSRDPRNRVLLIEAGGKDDYFWIGIPVGYLYTIANPRTDWCFKTEPDEHLAGRSIHYARGRVLGGCSSCCDRDGGEDRLVVAAIPREVDHAAGAVRRLYGEAVADET